MQPYGTILGTTHGNVLIYSNNKEDGYYQCVELARRYWLKNFNVEIPNVQNAYSLKDLKYVFDRKENRSIPVTFYETTSPKIGDLIIWKPVGVMKPHGHVAVIVKVGKHTVDIVEQNLKTFQRTLTLDKHRIECTYKTGKISGILRVK